MSWSSQMNNTSSNNNGFRVGNTTRSTSSLNNTSSNNNGFRVGNSTRSSSGLSNASSNNNGFRVGNSTRSARQPEPEPQPQQYSQRDQQQQQQQQQQQPYNDGGYGYPQRSYEAPSPRYNANNTNDGYSYSTYGNTMPPQEQQQQSLFVPTLYEDNFNQNTGNMGTAGNMGAIGNTQAMRNDNICNQHGLEFRYFCSTHECLHCIDCVVLDHSLHKCIPLDFSGSNSNNDQLSQLFMDAENEIVTKCKQRVNELRNQQIHNNRAVNNIQQNYNMMTNHVRDSFMQVRQEIDRKEQEIMSRLGKMVQSKAQLYNTQQNSLRDLMYSLENTLSRYESCKQESLNSNGTGFTGKIISDLFEIKSKLHSDLKDTDLLLKECKLNEEKWTFASKKAGSNMDIINKINEFGLIKSRLSGQLSKISGPGLKSISKTKLSGTFKIITYNEFGEKCDFGGNSSQISVKFSDDLGRSSKFEIVDENNGIYSVQYFLPQLQNLEKFTISVIVQGFVQTFRVMVTEYFQGVPVTTFGQRGQNPGNCEAPRGLCVAGKNSEFLFMVDCCNNRIQKFQISPDSDRFTLVKAFGSQGNGNGEFFFPRGICYNDFTNEILVADCCNNRVQVFDLDGNFVRKFGTRGKSNGRFELCWDLCCDEKYIYVSDWKNHRVQVFTHQGVFKRDFSKEGSRKGDFNGPNGICTDKAGKLYIVDDVNNRVQVFSTSGEYLYGFGEGDLKFPKEICYCDGYLYVSDSGNHRVRVYDREGNFIKQFGKIGSRSGEFNYPSALCSNGERLFVADEENNRICVFK